MQCLLLWLVIVGQTLVLLPCTESGLEIMPRALLIPNEVSNVKRQSQSESSFEAIFTCLQVIPDLPPHRPPSEVIWMKDGQVIETMGTKKYRHYRKKKRLLIRDPNEMDSGVYECALAPNSTEKGKAELWIAPRVISAPSPQELVVDTNGTVDCLVTGGARTIDWWRNRILIASSDTMEMSDSRYTVMSNGSLLITSIVRIDRGLYSCIVRNKAGQQKEDISVKVVTGRPELIPLPTPTPSTNIFPHGRSLSDLYTTPESLSTDCVEYGDTSFGPVPPLPTPPSLNRSTHMTEDLFTPSFTAIPPECVQTTVGYRIVLNCSAQGVPSPIAIQWKCNGEYIRTSSQVSDNGVQNHFVQLTDGSLMITKVQLQDRGRYTCIASNSRSNVSTDVQLKVKGEMEICGIHREVNGSNEEERQKRIVDGFAASGIDEWPWQVLLEYSDQDWGLSSTHPLFCGGTLIRPDWIVTAAHCLSYSGIWRSPSNLVVRMGVHNRTNRSEPHQQLLKVRRYVVHPSYTPSSSSFSKNDIALLELDHPVRLSPHAGIVCLPPQLEEPPVGSLCTVTGWGRLQHGVNEYPEVLHRAHVPLVSHDDCTSRESYHVDVTPNMLCAGYKDGGSDACQNDSGGPLVCEIPNSGGRWGLYGVVNGGEGCGAPNKYGVYARVTQYLRWINDNILL